MQIADLAAIAGRRYPARRLTQNVVGGPSPLQASAFAIGMVTLDPDGGQVPWHNQEQEEAYLVLEGEIEMCVGSERRILTAGQAVMIPPREFHQATNVGSTPDGEGEDRSAIWRWVTSICPANKIAIPMIAEAINKLKGSSWEK